MSFTDINFIVIYLPSEVTINYPISGNDIQHCFSPAHSYFSFGVGVGNFNKLTSLCRWLVEDPTIA